MSTSAVQLPINSQPSLENKCCSLAFFLALGSPICKESYKILISRCYCHCSLGPGLSGLLGQALVLSFTVFESPSTTNTWPKPRCASWNKTRLSPIRHLQAKLVYSKGYQLLSLIRLSDHCLTIEKGRHTKPKPKNNRICPLCNENEIEDAITSLCNANPLQQKEKALKANSSKFAQIIKAFRQMSKNIYFFRQMKIIIFSNYLVNTY